MAAFGKQFQALFSERGYLFYRECRRKGGSCFPCLFLDAGHLPVKPVFIDHQVKPDFPHALS